MASLCWYGACMLQRPKIHICSQSTEARSAFLTLMHAIYFRCIQIIDTYGFICLCYSVSLLDDNRWMSVICDYMGRTHGTTTSPSPSPRLHTTEIWKMSRRHKTHAPMQKINVQNCAQRRRPCERSTSLVGITLAMMLSFMLNMCAAVYSKTQQFHK